MAEEKNNEYKELYEYLRQVDEKVDHNDSTLKFITAQHAEQVKELMNMKSDGLRRFFEEAIKAQTEVVRNAYEEIISDLKLAYEKDLKNREVENIRLYNQKEEALKVSYEADCQKRINDCYIKARTDFDEEKIELILKYWHENNLRTKLHETEEYFKREMQRTADEAYANGKADTEAWHDDVVRQKLETQAQYFQQELDKFSDAKKLKENYEERIAEMNSWHEQNLAAKLEEMKNYYEGRIKKFWNDHEDIVRQKLESQADFFKGEIEHAKEEEKAEMMAQMDEAARRNEDELKLFLDFYESKIKPFKKFINIHETTDRRIKDIQQKLQKRFNKTFGNKDGK